MALTKVSYSMIQGAAYNVLDFGADPTGVASSVTAFNNAVANGGTVYVPTGTYKLNSKVTLSVDGTTLWLAANVTLNLSGVAAVQNPFGNQIDVRADNCAVIGSGPSSLLQMTNGGAANAVGLLHSSIFTVRDLTIDGDKTAVSGFTDDTFGSAISIVCTAAGGATTDARVTVDNVYMKNFFHYGVNIYGDQANGVKIVNCNIESMGVNAEALSTGAGIVSTVGPSDLTISNNVVKNGKWSGIVITGGENMATITIANNLFHQNGYSGNGDGISLVQQANYGSAVGKGIFNVAITGNVCTGNARSGINLAVSTVGFIKFITITGNTFQGNTLAGIELSSTNTSPSIVSEVEISGNLVEGNGTAQIAVNEYCVNVSGAERAFTPFISGTTSAGVGTYLSQVGTYTITNNIVYFQLEMSWTAHTGTGDILVSGFPYAAQNSQPTPIGWVWSNNLTITGQATFGLTGNQTYGPLGAVNNGAYTAVPIDTSAALRISGFYFIET
jgi:hypothetical protein